MRILAIESSCDETAAAVLETPLLLKSSVVSTQIEIHAPYGGVVPELASRHHLLAIVPVIESALEQAQCSMNDIDAVAATYGPGLIGSLLVGLQAAKGIASARNLPFVGVHHLKGHLCAPLLVEPRPELPFVALLVSGGHTGLYDVRDYDHITCLGRTRDDAAGEAFDKIAKLLGLGYPGGIAIENAARDGDIGRYKLPRPLRGKKSLDFSFSGLKTAARRAVEDIGGTLTPLELRDFCASVQQAIVDTLVNKARLALSQQGHRRLVVAGGVSANMHLRMSLDAMAAKVRCQVFYPPLQYCTDNAAMIAVAGAMRLQRGERDSLDLLAKATLALGDPVVELVPAAIA